jgi:hypothetical protein
LASNPPNNPYDGEYIGLIYAKAWEERYELKEKPNLRRPKANKCIKLRSKHAIMVLGKDMLMGQFTSF